MHRYQSLALYNRRAYVPTMGTAPSGLIYEIDPVAIVEPEHEQLVSLLHQRLAAKPKRVKEWYRGDPPRKSAVQIAAKARSWIAFARRSLRFALVETDDFWEVAVGEGPVRDDLERHRLPPDAGVPALARAVLDVAERRRIWASSPGRRTRG